MIEYSIPYILLIIFYAILAIYSYSTEDQEIRKRVDIAAIAMFVLFFGFRGFIGTDWTTYYVAYDKCDINDLTLNVFQSSDITYEPGYTLLELLCNSIHLSFQGFVLVCCLINTVLLFRFLHKRIDNLPLGLLLYICMGGFVMSTNLMRNSIAILLFANAIEYLFERKPIPYFSLCILALTFHVSSIFYFPLYFFFHKRCTKWVFLGLFIAGNIVFLTHFKLVSLILTNTVGLIVPKLSGMIEAYTEGGYGDLATGISIGYLERLLTGILIFCYYDKLCEIRKENAIFINSYIAYFIFFFYFSEFAIMSGRLSNLFTYFYWIIWIDLLYCFSIDNNRYLFIAFLTIYCIMKMIGMTKYKILEYDNTLFGAKTYNERLFLYYRYSNETEK